MSRKRKRLMTGYADWWNDPRSIYGVVLLVLIVLLVAAFVHFVSKRD
jgi:hypothetical protein